MVSSALCPLVKLAARISSINSRERAGSRSPRNRQRISAGLALSYQHAASSPDALTSQTTRVTRTDLLRVVLS